MKTRVRIVVLAVFSVLLLFASPGLTGAAEIPTWNVDVGIGPASPPNFLLEESIMFPSAGPDGNVQLGMRVYYLNSSDLVPLVDNTFTVDTSNGPWGIMFHAGYWDQKGDDGVTYFGTGWSGLDSSVLMNVTSSTTNTISSPFDTSPFDLRTLPNNNVTGVLPYLLGFAHDPNIFIQNALSIEDLPWLNQPVNPNALGTYTFEMVATDGESELRLPMVVQVVPAPGAGSLLALGGLLCVRRRR